MLMDLNVRQVYHHSGEASVPGEKPKAWYHWQRGEPLTVVKAKSKLSQQSWVSINLNSAIHWHL